jgi:hypothetical protein
MSEQKMNTIREFEFKNSCIMYQKYAGRIRFEIQNELIGNTAIEVCHSIIIKGLLSNPLANFAFEEIDRFEKLDKINVIKFNPETDEIYGFLEFEALKYFRLVRPNSTIVKINNDMVIKSMKVEVERRLIKGRPVIKYDLFDVKSRGLAFKQDGEQYFKELEKITIPEYKKLCEIYV